MKRLTENLALFTVITLALSLYRLLLYYRVFGIDIVEYIDVSEIIQAQFFPLLGVTMLVVLVALFAILLVDSKVKLTEADSINRYLSTLSNFDLYKIISVVFASIVMLFLICGHMSANDAHNMVAGKDFRRVVLTMEKDTITTDTTLIYTGKTKSYIFLFNRKTNESTVLKTDDVDRITISKWNIK